MMMDVIIRGGMVVDGTGAPGYRADVAVQGDTIAEIGELGHLHAACELDASGCMVTPGLIDAHAHSDTCFLQDDSCASKLYQGITLEITGQCGDSPFPAGDDNEPWQCASFDAFLDRVHAGGQRIAVHQAMLAGHGSLRAAVMGYEDRTPTADELERMKQLLRRDLRAGAFGMSMGLEYAPGFFAAREELCALGSVVREAGGIVTCHMRDEGQRVFDALEELLHIGRHTGVHVHVSHIKLDHHSMHGRAENVWRMIEQARREGVRVTADCYPFTASCTTLTIRCPRWSLDGGNAALLAHLRGARCRDVIEGIRSHYPDAIQAESCLFCGDGGLWPDIVGKTLREVAENLLGTRDYAWAAAQVLLRTQARADCIFFVMDAQDMKYFLRQGVMIGSDGWALSGDPVRVPGKPHPRSYAAVSEFLRLCREEQLCPPEEAIRRITSAPADLLHLEDRGRLRVGLKADIAVMDWQAIKPVSTYLDPVRLSRGVRHVLVDGAVALENGSQTDVRNGEFLRKT